MFRIVCRLSFLLMCPILQLMAVPATADEAASNKFYLDSVWYARDLLRTGEVRVSAKLDSPRGVHDTEYHIAFDFDNDCIRFDGIDSDGNWKYARNQKESLQQVGSDDYVDKCPANEPMAALDMRPFDLRALGMMTIGEFDYREPYQKIRDYYQTKVQLADISVEKDGIVKAVWDCTVTARVVDRHDKAKRTIWFDKNQGFSPIKMTAEILNSVSGQFEIDTETTTSWKKVNSVWVPTNCHIGTPGYRNSVDLSFDWVSVNQPLNENLFTEQGMGLKTGDEVWNCRLTPPVVEATVGTPGIGEVTRSTNLRRMLLIGNVILAVLLMLALGYRYWVVPKGTSG
jgi:hypothetical protein